MQKQQDYLLLLLLVHMQGSRSAKREDDEERKSKGRRRRKKKEIWRCFLLVSLRDMTVIRRCRLTYPIHLKRILLCLSCSSFQLMDKQKCCCYCVCVCDDLSFSLYISSIVRRMGWSTHQAIDMLSIDDAISIFS